MYVYVLMLLLPELIVFFLSNSATNESCKYIVKGIDVKNKYYTQTATYNTNVKAKEKQCLLNSESHYFLKATNQHVA